MKRLPQFETSLFARVFRNEHLEIACHALVLVLIGWQAFTFHAFAHRIGAQDPTDFIAFHVSGRMALSGQAQLAYDATAYAAALARVAELGGMPWAYPPPMFLVCSLLAHLPLWAAYLAWMLSGYLTFAVALRKLAGSYSAGALALVLPAMLINARTGQTGFWIAAMQGWFLIAGLGARKAVAGLPLGFLALKPHLAIGLGFGALFRRCRTDIAIAVAVALALCAAATLVFGMAIWPAFLEGARRSGRMLAEGDHALSRMISVYAFVLRAGAPAGLAFALHGAVLAGALGLIAWGAGRKWPERFIWAAAVFAGLLASPYAYDYDLVALSLAAGLLLPALCRSAGSTHLAALMLLCWIATANSPLVLAQIFYWGYLAPAHGHVFLMSFSAPALVLAGLMTLKLLWRTPVTRVRGVATTTLDPSRKPA